MKKTFCDRCTKEFSKEDHQSLYIVDEKTQAVISLDTWMNKGYKGGDICNKCTIEVINNGTIKNDSEMEDLQSDWSSLLDYD